MTPVPITIPDRPSMPRAAAAFVKARLATSRCFLEYGAGGSTVLAAALGVARIYSVESDGPFLAAVAAKVAARGGGADLRQVLVDIGPTQRWGHPVGRTRIDAWPDYSTRVWDEIERAGDRPDTILVDGRFRVACCAQSLLRMPDDALILFDDYFDREDRYGAITHFAPVAERHDRLAVFRKPAECDWQGLRALYAEYARAPA